VDDKFGNVTPLTRDDFKEGWPRISPDGNWLYFYSNRPGSFGRSDIFVWKLTPDGELGRLIHLDASINTAGSDNPGCIYEDEFYFVSGNWREIRVARFVEPGNPEAGFEDVRTLSELNKRNIPLGIPSISHDGTMLFFSDRPDRWQDPGTRPGGKGGSDIWVALRPRLADRRFGPWEEPQNLGSVNTELNEFNPWPCDEGRRLLFLQAEREWTQSYLWEVPLDATYCPSPPFFRRGDANTDGKTDLSDAVFILNYLLTGGPSPSCLDAADCNDSGGSALDLSDPVYLLGFLFLGGPELPAPFDECGPDPTTEEDDLYCETFPPCDSPG
jgi:hypothetical protein